MAVLLVLRGSGKRETQFLKLKLQVETQYSLVIFNGLGYNSRAEEPMRDWVQLRQRPEYLIFDG
jgi:hypothetical protein